MKKVVIVWGIKHMEAILTALVDFLLYQDDAKDLEYIQDHRRDRLLTFKETFK